MSDAHSKHPLSFFMASVALVILVNPMPLLFDFIPDVIAYILLVLAIKRVADVEPAFDDAKEALSKMLIINAFKIPSFFVMLMIWGGDSAQQPIVAVFTFVFSIIECCYALPAFHCLFDAFYKLGERYNCEAALGEGRGSLRMRPERIEKMTMAFIVVRAAMSCLPEMALVPSSAYRDGGINWNAMYPIFAILAAIVVLVFGIVWCSYFIAYLNRMRADQNLISRLDEAYIQAPHQRERVRFYRIRALMILYIIAIMCSFDLVLDEINYLPDFTAAIALFGAALMLFYLLRRGVASIVMVSLYGVATLVDWIVTLNFNAKYDLSAITYAREVADAYRTILIIEALKEALLIAVCIILLYSLYQLIATEIGGGELEEHRHVARLTRRELNKKMTVATVFGILSAIASFFDDLTMISTKQLAADPTYTDGFITVPTLDWFWIVVIVFKLAWLVSSLCAFARLKEEASLNCM